MLDFSQRMNNSSYGPKPCILNYVFVVEYDVFTPLSSGAYTKSVEACLAG